MKIISFIIGSIIVIATLIANFIIFPKYFSDKMGQYGDIFGFSNAMFTGFALAFLIYGIFLQREEIKIAKEDLNRTKSILDKQNSHLNEQGFDGRFFSVIKLLTDFILSLTHPNNVNLSGYEALYEYCTYIARWLRTGEKYLSCHEFIDKYEKDASYSRKVNKAIDPIMPLLRIIHNILIYIDKNDVDKSFYVDVLKSVVGPHVPYILPIYMHVNNDREGVRLIKKYKLFKWHDGEGGDDSPQIHVI